MRRLGPVATAVVRRAGLGDMGALLRRGTHNPNDDDEAVIQDESPAARIDGGDNGTPALQPLGTLTASPPSLPPHRILSRRSPRGPPIF